MNILISILLSFSLTQCPNVTLLGAGTCKSGGGGAAPIVADTCSGNGFGSTTANCSGFSSLASGDIITVFAYTTAGTPTVSGCGGTWTQDTAVSGTARAYNTTGTVGACTPVVTGNSGASVSIYGVHITGSTGVVSGGTTADQGSISTGSTINAPSVTTSTSNNLVIGMFCDYDASGDTFTAGGSATISVQNTNFGSALEKQTQVSAGAVAPTATSNKTAHFASATLAVHP